MNTRSTVPDSAWNTAVQGNALLHFAAVCLRGAGQVMFQNNALTGLLFFIGIFWGAYTAGLPAVAWGSVVGTVVGTLTAYALNAPRNTITMGLHGYNGLLVGCALPTFFAATPLLWGCLVVGAVFSTVLMMAVTRIMRTWKISAMTGPFVFTTWFFMLAAYTFSGITITGLPHPAVAVRPPVADLYSLNLPEYLRACCTGISQVFLINNVITGMLFVAGLAVSSIWAAVFAVLGSALAVAIALLLGAGTSSIVAGLFQYSAVLTAVGLGTAFYRPNRRVAVYTVLAVLFTVTAQGALNVVLNTYGIPTLTFPFVIAAWIFLLPNPDLLPETHRPDSPSNQPPQAA